MLNSPRFVLAAISLISEFSITCCIILSHRNWWLNWWSISIFTTQTSLTRIIFLVKGIQNMRCHVPGSSCIFITYVIPSIAFFRCGVPTVDSLLKTSDVKSSAILIDRCEGDVLYQISSLKSLNPTFSDLALSFSFTLSIQHLHAQAFFFTKKTALRVLESPL